MHMKLSVVIPAYNEAARLKKNVVAIIGYLERYHPSYEVIIVNDGSTDRTNHVINTIQSNFPHVRSIECITNKGKGFAVKKGILKAVGSNIFFLDADGSTPIDALEDLLPQLESGKADVVIGSRNMTESSREVTQPMYRQLIGKGGTLLIRALLLPDIHDSQCGFKGFTKKAAHDIFSRTTIKRWGFDFEVLVLARHLGYSVIELPVRWLDVKGSRLRPARGAMFTLVELLRVKYNITFGRYKKNSN
jgi:dolichyl-phosphate beta-glucosyltransferase